MAKKPKKRNTRATKPKTSALKTAGKPPHSRAPSSSESLDVDSDEAGDETGTVVTAEESPTVRPREWGKHPFLHDDLNGADYPDRRGAYAVGREFRRLHWHLQQFTLLPEDLLPLAFPIEDEPGELIPRLGTWAAVIKRGRRQAQKYHRTCALNLFRKIPELMISARAKDPLAIRQEVETLRDMFFEEYDNQVKETVIDASVELCRAHYIDTSITGEPSSFRDASGKLWYANPIGNGEFNSDRLCRDIIDRYVNRPLDQLFEKLQARTEFCEELLLGNDVEEGLCRPDVAEYLRHSAAGWASPAVLPEKPLKQQWIADVKRAGIDLNRLLIAYRSRTPGELAPQTGWLTKLRASLKRLDLLSPEFQTAILSYQRHISSARLPAPSDTPLPTSGPSAQPTNTVDLVTLLNDWIIVALRPRPRDGAKVEEQNAATAEIVEMPAECPSKSGLILYCHSGAAGEFSIEFKGQFAKITLLDWHILYKFFEMELTRNKLWLTYEEFTSAWGDANLDSPNDTARDTQKSRLKTKLNSIGWTIDSSTERIGDGPAESVYILRRKRLNE